MEDGPGDEEASDGGEALFLGGSTCSVTTSLLLFNVLIGLSGGMVSRR